MVGEGPVTQAEPIDMENFVERMTSAVLKGMLRAGLNPQPLPPKEGRGQEDGSRLNPQPLPPFDITVGLVISSGDELALERSKLS